MPEAALTTSESCSTAKTTYEFFQLQPSQIAEFWNYFEYGLEQSLPPDAKMTEEYSANVLTACLAGWMQAWMAFSLVDGKRGLIAVVITEITANKLANTRNLLIHSLYGFGGAPNYPWIMGMRKLMEFAKEHGCSKVLGYSPYNNVIRIAQALKCRADVCVLEWEVE